MTIKAKAKSDKPTTKASNKPVIKNVKEMTEGYKGHKPNSRKGQLHELYDKEGPEVAWTRGLKMGLSENSLRSWFRVWRGSASKPAKVAKPKVAKVKKANGAEATASA
jgi:hypothetical protein